MTPHSHARRRRSGALRILLGLAAGLLAAPSHPDGGADARPFIIRLQSGVGPGALLDLARRWGFQCEHVYSSVYAGGSARLTSPQRRALMRDPRVRSVRPDGRIRLPSPLPGEADVVISPLPHRPPAAQVLPTGVDWIGAGSSLAARIDGFDDAMPVDVAVLDTGIDLNHPDLRVVGGYNAVRGGDYRDYHGHGTHVAGTIAALDNGFGVVGVAPGARLWSVRVLPRSGSGRWSDVIRGLDWVTQRAGTIEVANLSLGDQVVDDSDIHAAVQACVGAGVTLVVAAGNDGRDINATPGNPFPVVPAFYDEVISVSALADSNGSPSLGPSPFKVRKRYHEQDETFADFSNHGAGVALIAPGVKIRSTYRNRRYLTATGTSQAAPHAAGAAALYLLDHPEATPAQVKAALRNLGRSFTPPDDPDGIHEPAVDVRSL